MAETVQRNLPAQFIEDLGKDYATQLTAATAQALPTQQFAPTVAGQTALQQEATQRTQAGLGTFQPFLTAAQQAGTTAGTGLGLAQTGLGVAGQELTGAGQALGTAGTTIAGAQPFVGAAGTGLTQAGATLGGVSPFIGAAQTGLGTAAGLTGTGAGSGVGSIESYMSPFQQQVIDTTLADFDRQAAARQQAEDNRLLNLEIQTEQKAEQEKQRKRKESIEKALNSLSDKERAELKRQAKILRESNSPFAIVGRGVGNVAEFLESPTENTLEFIAKLPKALRDVFENADDPLAMVRSVGSRSRGTLGKEGLLKQINTNLFETYPESIKQAAAKEKKD